jgi:hypothetical protein
MADSLAVATIAAAAIASIPSSLAAVLSHRTRKDIGSNGTSVIDLQKSNETILTKLLEDSSYTHTRNHDIINLLVRIDGRLAIAFPLDKNPLNTELDTP